jgi:hypothetical protein
VAWKRFGAVDDDDDDVGDMIVVVAPGVYTCGQHRGLELAGEPGVYMAVSL